MQSWFVERPVGEIRPGDHASFSFATGEEQEQVVGTFVHDGLGTSEKVIYISDAQPWQLPGIRNRIDAGRFAETGQLRVIPRETACLTRGHFDPDRMLAVIGGEIAATAEEGYHAVRVTADMSWLLGEPGGYGLMLASEARFDAAVTPGAMIMAICQLNRNSCTPDQLIGHRNTHEIRVTANPEYDDGVLRITRIYDPYGLRLEGELDGARHTAFTTTLSSVTGANTDVHLDFAHLRFLDLGTLNLLVTHAMRLPPGHDLVLDNLPPDVEAVIHTVGWHHLPGLSHGRREQP